MCGIVGSLGCPDVSWRIVEGLSRREYRGYDSVGRAVLEERGGVAVRRSVGKLAALGAALEADPVSGRAGIGHARWAMHGAATEVRAHPQRSRAAQEKGTDVDGPRNLAKSVTVE